MSRALAAIVACGGRKPASTPPATPATTEPATTEQCAAPGTPCDTPNASSGDEACREAKGFCNVVVCRNGSWQNLEVLPPFGFQVSCFPIKVKAASGGWIRAVAIIDD